MAGPTRPKYSELVVGHKISDRFRFQTAILRILTGPRFSGTLNHFISFPWSPSEPIFKDCFYEKIHFKKLGSHFYKDLKRRLFVKSHRGLHCDFSFHMNHLEICSDLLNMLSETET